MIDSLMCIGSACEGHELAKKIDLRVKGPVDNLSGKGFYVVESLFNGTLEKEVLNKSYKVSKIDHPELYHTRDTAYDFDCGYSMVHNDITQEETYEEMITRLNIFNKYVEKAKDNPNMYYLYTLNFTDKDLTKEDLKVMISKLPQEIVSKIIVLQTRFCNKAFTEFFPCLVYDDYDFFWRESPNEARKRFKEFIKTNNL